jgi:hypothetical protein
MSYTTIIIALSLITGVVLHLTLGIDSAPLIAGLVR